MFTTNKNVIQYNGNLGWLRDRTILYCRHGSHAYGLNIETSDEDFKGVAIPPPQYRNGFLNTFEQAESKVPDTVIFDIRKFFKLAADCNPNIIEVLWCEPLYSHFVGDQLQENRGLFLSQKAKHTFSGYAMSQLKRIRGHYRWIKDPPQTPPTRESLGLPPETVVPADQLAAVNALIADKLSEWNVDWLGDLSPDARIAVQDRMAAVLAEVKMGDDEVWRSAGRQIGLSENFIEIMAKERVYATRKREWGQYQNWKATRNPQRAVLEEKFGYDTKHAMHLVRLLRMCREIVERGEVNVRRPDREELLAIRAGSRSYEDLVTWAEGQDAEISVLLARSPLPKSPDREALDKLCCELIGEFEDFEGNLGFYSSSGDE